VARAGDQPQHRVASPSRARPPSERLRAQLKGAGMALFPLLFGHAEWPVEAPERRRPRPFAYDPDEVEPTRVTLTVPVALKTGIEASAAIEGLPPDAWIRRALSRSVDPRLTAR
jgi:hypothetical protein